MRNENKSNPSMFDDMSNKQLKIVYSQLKVGNHRFPTEQEVRLLTKNMSRSDILEALNESLGKN